MRKIRIVKRTRTGYETEYVIQKKHWLFRHWVDCAEWRMGVLGGYGIPASYKTLKDAEWNLCYHDGTKTVEEVVREPKRT